MSLVICENYEKCEIYTNKSCRHQKPHIEVNDCVDFECPHDCYSKCIKLIEISEISDGFNNIFKDLI